MSVRAHRRLVLALSGVSLLAFAGGGCCPRCSSECTPRGPWQSPTIQATRAFLVVNTEELRILCINGRNVRPSCIGDGGVREYHLPAGMHSVTAAFRYAAPVSGGLIGSVWGVPVTIEKQFIVGHEYVPVYREHTHPEAECEYLLEAIASTISPRRSWSLDIVDLATVEHSTEPEVVEARRYCNTVHGLASSPQSPALY